MRRRIIRKLICLLLVGTMLSSGLCIVGSAETISDLEKKKQDAVKEKNAIQSEANDLKANYNDVQSTYNDLKAKVDANDAAVIAASNDMATLSQQLSEAKTSQAEMEQVMKLHIKYMYENGSMNMLETLLESGSLSEFLERFEYLNYIVKYDRDIMDQYKKVQEEVTAKTNELTIRRAELEAKSNELDKQKQELKSLVDSAGSALSDKNAELKDAQSEVDAYDKKIKEMKEYEKQLAKENAARQEALASQVGGNNEDTSGALEGYSQDDLYLLAAIIHAEAEGEPYEGKIAVGSVVMNRVFSSKFPNTISSVIYQANQFEPVRSGRLQMIMDKGPNEDCFSAAREVLNGRRNVDKLFFWALWLAQQRGKTGGIIIGKQYFY